MADNAAVVRQLIDEVWNKGNFALCEQLLKSDVLGYDPLGGEMRGIDSFKNYVQALRTAFPDLKVTAHDVDSIGDKVYVRWTATGTHKGTLAGIAPTNNQGTTEGITINRFENGKIVESRYEWDSLALFQQMGLIPKMEKLPLQQAAPVQARH